ncbi:O-antigen ligase family protein [Aeribacillus pallidus]|jgi:putative inorganic carbon (hco3(-)) transporter|uniref:O-antigen ligase family protein n=1 Tax=Aeribacillus pallidus TaxID=33936 RepID=UPI003D2258B6
MTQTKNSLTYYITLIMLAVIPIVYFKTYIGPLPLSAEVVLIPLLVLSFVYDYRKGNIEFNRFNIRSFFIAFLLFLLAAIASLVKAESLSPAVMEIARYLSYVFLFLILVKVKFSKEQYLNFAKAFGIAALIVGLFGIFQYVFNFSLNKAGLYALKEAKGRVDSTLINPNYYSSFLNFVIPTLLLLAVVYFKEKKVQLMFFAFYAIYVINLILTYTRAAWVTMIGGLLLILMIMPKKFIKGFIKPHILLSFIALTIFVYFMPDVQERTHSALYAIEKLVFKNTSSVISGPVFGDDDEGDETTDEEMVEEDETTNRAVVSRVTLWKTGWVMFRDNPVLGVGMGNYYVRYKDFVTKYPELDIGHEAYSVHNSYLKVAAETGTIGLMTFMAIYVLFFLQVAKLYFAQRERLGKVLAAGLFVGAATFMVQNLSNNLMFIPQLNVIFWLVSALVIAFLHQLKEQAL